MLRNARVVPAGRSIRHFIMSQRVYSVTCGFFSTRHVLDARGSSIGVCRWRSGTDSHRESSGSDRGVSLKRYIRARRWNGAWFTHWINWTCKGSTGRNLYTVRRRMDERRWAFDRVALVARVLVIVTIMSHFMSCLSRFLHCVGAACKPTGENNVAVNLSVKKIVLYRQYSLIEILHVLHFNF